MYEILLFVTGSQQNYFFEIPRTAWRVLTRGHRRCRRGRRCGGSWCSKIKRRHLELSYTISMDRKEAIAFSCEFFTRFQQRTICVLLKEYMGFVLVVTRFGFDDFRRRDLSVAWPCVAWPCVARIVENNRQTPRRRRYRIVFDLTCDIIAEA